MSAETGLEGAAFRYWAFISYSHRDRFWGDWLHRRLERYRLPWRLRGRPGRDGALPARLLPVFRDREELPTSADLGGAIDAGLRASRYLVVICSPASAKSIWVNAEVLAFKRMGRADRIMCLVVDGEPNASDRGRPELECFCPALRHEVDAAGEIGARRVEPLAADVSAVLGAGACRRLAMRLPRFGIDPRHWRCREALIKLIAGILGIDFDRLWRRERRRRLWHRCQVAALAVAVAIGAAAGWRTLQRSEALELASRAQELIRAERHDEALKVVLNAMPEPAMPLLSAPLVAEAEAVLDLALAGNRLHAVLGGIKYETESLAMSREGGLMATSSRDGTVRLWNTDSWAQLAVWTTFDRVPGPGLATAPRAEPERARRPLAMHPSQPLVASGTADGRVMLFRAGLADPVATMRHASGFAASAAEIERRRFVLRAVAFDASGASVLSAAGDETVRVWDWQRGVERIPALRHSAPVLDAAFDPSGRLIASLSEDGFAWLWDAASGRLLSSMHTGAGVFSMLRFNPRGDVLAVAADWRVGLWQIATPEQPEIVAELAHDDAVRWIEFGGADGELLATAGDDGAARLWDAATGALMARLPHRRSVRRALFDPRGGRLATLSEDRLVQVWNSGSGTPLRGYALRGHTHFVLAGAYTPDGRFLVTASSDMSLRVWDMADASRGLRLGGHRGAVRQAAFLPDGQSVLTVGLDRRILLHDAADGRRLQEIFNAHGDRVLGMALSPRGDHLVTVSRDRTARLWALVDWRSTVLARDVGETAPRSHDDEVVSAAFSPDGRRVVTASRDSTARVWDVATAAPATGIGVLRHTGGKPIWTAAFSPDGRLIVTAGHDEQAGVWDAATGAHLRWLRPRDGRQAGMSALAVSPDGGMVATASDDRSVRLWDLRSGAQLGAPLLHDAAVTAVAFHPAGRQLLSGTVNGALRLWSVPDGGLRRIRYVHGEQTIRSIAFDAAGRRVVTASEDGSAMIWSHDVAGEANIARAFEIGRRICGRTPGTPSWSDVWRWCPLSLATAGAR